MAFARHRLFALFSPALLLGFSLSTGACDKKDEAKIDRSKTSDKAEAIPTDFVLNPFMPEVEKTPVQVRGADGGQFGQQG